ncbi:hypothetical protein V1520DRAFT_351781 [Lipomyces starkeyi]
MKILLLPPIDGMKKYEKYYTFMDDSDTYYTALILDPRVKGDLLLGELQGEEAGGDILHAIRDGLHQNYPLNGLESGLLISRGDCAILVKSYLRGPALQWVMALVDHANKIISKISMPCQMLCVDIWEPRSNGYFVSQVSAYIADFSSLVPLQNANIILGFNWWERYNPDIDWRNKTVDFTRTVLGKIVRETKPELETVPKEYHGLLEDECGSNTTEEAIQTPRVLEATA